MAKPFFDVDSKMIRLNGSVCMYDGEPVYVLTHRQYGHDPHTVREFEVITYPIDKIGDGEPKMVTYTDPKFSIASPPLGYVNEGNKAKYYSRMPRRQQLAGLSRYNITGEPRFSKEWIDCIKGLYPTYEKATEMLSKDGIEAVAFSRIFAVEKFGRSRIVLKHRDRVVGWKSLNDKDFTLFKAGDNCPVSKALKELGVPHGIEGSNNQGLVQS